MRKNDSLKKDSEIKPTENVEEKVVDMSDLEEDVAIIEQVVPKYPEIARRAGVESRLLLEVIIDEKGCVQYAEVIFIDNKGYGFEKSAIAAVMKLRFKPVIVDGQAVKVKIIYPIDFVLVE